MRIFPQEGECPHCHAVITIKKLRKIPFSGSLKWYELTPSPRQACPECKRLVRHTMTDSKWLYLPFIMISIVIGCILLGAKPSVTAQILIILISVMGVHLAMRQGKFVSDEQGVI